MWSDEITPNDCLRIVNMIQVDKHTCVSKSVLLSDEAIDLTQSYIENVLIRPAIFFFLVKGFLDHFLSSLPPVLTFHKEKEREGRKEGREEGKEINYI